MLSPGERVLRPGRLHRDERRREDRPPVVRVDARRGALQSRRCASAGRRLGRPNQASSPRWISTISCRREGRWSTAAARAADPATFGAAASLRRCRAVVLAADSLPAYFRRRAPRISACARPSYVVAGVDDRMLRSAKIIAGAPVVARQSFTGAAGPRAALKARIRRQHGRSRSVAVLPTEVTS